jgi:hypothetical protein
MGMVLVMVLVDLRWQIYWDRVVLLFLFLACLSIDIIQSCFFLLHTYFLCL